VRNTCIFIFNSDPPPFQSTYRKWAKRNNFLSKLPGDAKMQREAEEEVARTLDRDLREKKPHKQVIPYSDKEFVLTTKYLVSSPSALFAANPSP
jgi:hypothetical protein